MPILLFFVLFFLPISGAYAKELSFDLCKKVLHCTEKAPVDATSEINFMNGFLNKSYEERYDYFSESYKEGLQSAFKIKNAKEYAELKKKEDHEFIILNERIIEIEKNNETFLKVFIFACWTQEGYEGFKTYEFSLMKINKKWKITHIAS
jgi:hypothetical protein